MFLDNGSKILEPLMVLVCAKAYAGGEWGVFKYYESLILLLLRLASLGLDRGVIWYYSKCADDKEYIQNFSRIFNLVFTLSLLIVGFLFLQQLEWLPGKGLWTHNIPQIGLGKLMLFLLALPLQAGTLLMTQAFINKKMLGYSLIVRNFILPFTIYGPAIFLAWTFWKPYGLAWPYFIGNLLGFVFSIVACIRCYHIKWENWSWSIFPPSRVLKFSLPLSTTDFVMSFATRMDVILLAKYAGIEAVEVYSIIVMIANTLRSLRQSFDGIMLAVFSKHGDDLQTEKMKNFNYATWLVTSVQIPIFYFAYFFGKELLSLIGATYAQGNIALLIAVFFILINNIGAFSGQVIMGMGKSFMIPVSQGIFFCLSTTLNFLLVPHWGLEGAAFAIGLSNFVGGLTVFIGLRIFTKSWFVQWNYIWPMFLSLIIFAPFALIQSFNNLHLGLRVILFTLPLIIFGLITKHYWKKFNTYHA